MTDRNSQKFTRQAGCGSKNALKRARRKNQGGSCRKNRKKEGGK